MLPTDRRGVGQQFIRRRFPCRAEMRDGISPYFSQGRGCLSEKCQIAELNQRVSENLH
jgi:hypothetical protein